MNWSNIPKDWFGDEVQPAPSWALAMDSERLWFFARHERQPLVHSDAKPGTYLAGLWEYDVAELFICDPVEGHYMELNLGPNGAWWSCEFVAPRLREYDDDFPLPGVQTYAGSLDNGGWSAAISLPLRLLKHRLSFGGGTTANVTFILNSPDQRFLTATPLGEGEPDFHRPSLFSPLQVVEGDLPDTASKP